MSNIPKTLNEIRRYRASTKRKIINLLKEGDSLTQSADSGLPSTEFIKLAEQIRVQLDVLHANNEQYINLKCSVLVLGADATEEKRGVEEETIADTETNYLDEVRDRAVPMIHELIKISEHVLHRDSPPIPISTAPTAQMQKLKFPTFSGDIREYKRFRELFIHFTNHLNHIECLYQLVECMQRPAERNKIKPCTDYHRAWQILDEHYGDDDRLVDILLRDIENLNSYATKGRVNLAEMETFTESIQNFITQVEGINMTQDLNGRLLVTQIRRKLPEEHCLLFLQRVADGKLEDSVYGLAKWLNSHLILLKKINSQSECVNHSPFLPTSKSAGQSTVSPGVRGRKENDATPKCPIHTDMSNHFLKGCYKFRNLTQAEKFDLMNTHEICHRCGHNNCVAGKHPFNHDDCQFIANCQIPTCGMNTHFSSICPRVYGLDGYNHFDRKSTRVNALNADAENCLPSKSPPIYKNSNPTSESSSSDKERITCALPTVMGYIRHGGKKTKVRILLDTGSQISLIREGIIPQSDICHMQDFNLTTVGGDTANHKLRVVECTLESLDGTFNREVRLTEMKRPCGDAQIVTNSQLRHYPHLEDIDIVEAHDETIDVLLGVENGDILTSEERVLGTDFHDPVAVRCMLGWYIQGGRCAEGNRAKAVVNFTQMSAISDVEYFVGIEPRYCKCVTEEQTMKESVGQQNNGTYQSRLPWRKSPQCLPNNYDYAVKRLVTPEIQSKNKPSPTEEIVVLRLVAAHNATGDSENYPNDDIAMTLDTHVGEITYDFDPVPDIAYIPSGPNVNVVSRVVDVSQLQKVIDVPVDNDDSEQNNFHVRNAKVQTLNVIRLAHIVDPTKFSSWPRLLMTTARVMFLKDVPRTQWLDENAKRGLWKMAEIGRVGGRSQRSAVIRHPASI